MANHCYIFAKEAFSKREAWSWLIDKAVKAESQIQVNSTLRSLAKEWRWHKSKVERFLKILVKEDFIRIDIKDGYTVIVIAQNSYQQILKSDTSFGSRDKIETEVETKSETASAQEIHGVEENSKTLSETVTETILGQYQKNDDFSEIEKKEEKKKRTKKRKEEKYTKEKYSLKGIQKERYEDFENHSKDSFLLIEPLPIQSGQTELMNDSITNKTSLKSLEKKIDLQKGRKTVEQVEVDDVALWAENNLPASAEINLEWELGKFQDYYRASSTRLPKDGVAAFRNWLRKATEFKKLKQSKTGENLDGRYKNYYNRPYEPGLKESTGFERFLAGGFRAIS